jgi:hypothetical protein
MKVFFFDRPVSGGIRSVNGADLERIENSKFFYSEQNPIMAN